MSPTDGLLKFTGKHLDRLESAAARVLTTRDIDSVHELRVSSRRLSEPLELIGTLLREKHCRKLRKRVRTLRDALRTVRDVDVLRLALTRDNGGLSDDAEALLKLQGVIAIQREADLLSARKKIRAAKPKRIGRAIAELCKEVEAHDAKRDRVALSRNARRLWTRKAEELLNRAPAREHGPGLHKTRIRLKAFRYSTELMSRLDGTDRDELLRVCAAMQDRLGAWNDHFSAARLLGQIAQDGVTLAAGPEWSAQILELAAHRARQMNDELEEILSEWPRLRHAIESTVLGRVQSEPAATSRSKVANLRLAAERA